MKDLTEALVELIRLTSTDLPEDVEKALTAAREREAQGSAARGALDTILENVDLARRSSVPICQDTGTPIFYVKHPEGWSTRRLRVDRYGRYTEMKGDDPGRAIYLDGLTLRNALGLAGVGFGVSNLAIAVGAVTIILGLTITGLAVPVHIAILGSERLLKPERAVGGLREAPQTA